MKHELLIPVGNMECLKSAVYNGADAVYLALKNFGARKYASNFTKEELNEAISFCHLYNVKVYVTMNTLIKDSEVEQFLKDIYDIHVMGVDAVIMQDFGMMCLVREKYPNLEIHASTQFNNSNKDTIELLEQIGIKRVVFSRELSLEEIEKIDTTMEKEVFIHGALCVSYSGNCLMSSMLGGRSGNRGECTGCCRLPYTLNDSNKEIESKAYLLSMKELNATQHIEELKNSNILSFKIEGRMKSESYVAFITKLYRKLLDGENFDLDEEVKKLKVLFNREFSEGHLFKSKDNINKKSPNHIGLEIGKVVAVTPKKIKIKLTEDIHQEDSIRFYESNTGFTINYLYDEKNNLINHAKSGSIIYLDNKVGLNSNDKVMKTKDYLLMKELSAKSNRKIPIMIKVRLYLNKPLELEVECEDIKLKRYGEIVEKAKNAPLEKEDIKIKIEKLGNTPFTSIDTSIEMDDNIFVPIKTLNILRREIVEELEGILRTRKKEVIKKEVKFEKFPTEIKNGISASVFTQEQLETCLSLGFSRIYVPHELYDKYKTDKRIYYKRERNTYNPSKQERMLVGEYLPFSKDSDVVLHYSLNIYNRYTLYYLRKHGFRKFILSVELSKEEIANLISLFEKEFLFLPDVEIMCYGRYENMLIKGNILNLEEGRKTYTLKNDKEAYFPVYYDGINTYVYHSNNLVQNINIGSKYFAFFDETKEEIFEIVKNIG